MNTNKKLNIYIKIAILSAIAFILMMFEFPVVPAFPWLKIDISDMPALMGAFAFGPVAGIVIELLKNIIFIMFRGTSTGGVGELANFLIGVSFIVPASLIYHKTKTRKSAIIGMIVGTISIIIVGILANVYILLPLFGMKMSSSQLMTYIFVGLVPINGLKAILNSGITLVLYKKLSTTIFKVQPMLTAKDLVRKKIETSDKKVS
ncbi:ECF transporter S component [uncultured Clostridium sp.]|jgi:riboflavin transporter FmnP|uniref:ECF transporter S component n=1 Tax=uncultured Clostridium sp. TaxID=59620 RepID=UPI0026354568|nr:ECF transporter S component [uncultured Clostridium sp.]